MKKYKPTLTILTVLFFHLQSPAQVRQENSVNWRTLIVFFDGLRPDYITPQLMPNLFAFKQKGSYGNQHHSVFPTVTRVNSSSYATGSYPEKHGLMGNTVYFPEVNKVKGLNTGEAKNLLKINTATGGKLLTSVSIGEVLKSAGQKMMVFSSGSTGQALLQNHTLSGGAIINPDMILPSEIKEEVIKHVGALPKQKQEKHRWVADALIHYGFADDGPLVNAIWFSDPDGNAHEHGIGSPEAMTSIKEVDKQFGRILDHLKTTGLSKNYNILVSTDHGFVTYIGNENLSEFLIKKGFKASAESEDVVVSEGAIYVKDHNEQKIRAIVSSLQGQNWIGGIFTRASVKDPLKGFIEGTISFESIHWGHSQRAADILVDKNWNDDKNVYGYAGSGFSKGVAGHGSLSPYEVHIPLILSGPAFKENYISELPTSNVDIVPTVLRLHNFKIPSSMNGRPVTEFLKSGPAAPVFKKQEITVRAKHPDGNYTLTLYRTVSDQYQYIDYAKVVR